MVQAKSQQYAYNVAQINRIQEPFRTPSPNRKNHIHIRPIKNPIITKHRQLIPICPYLQITQYPHKHNRQYPWNNQVHFP